MTQAFGADTDAEMTAVYAVMALHEGYLVTPESQGAASTSSCSSAPPCLRPPAG